MKKLLKVIAVFAAAALVVGCVEDETMMGYSGHGGYRPVTTASNSYSGYSSHGNAPAAQQPNGGYQSHGNQPVGRRWHSVARTNTPPVGYQGAVAKSAGASGAYTYSGSAPSASGYTGR